MDATQLSNLSLFVLNHFSGIWIINWHADAEALAISRIFSSVIHGYCPKIKAPQYRSIQTDRKLKTIVKWTGSKANIRIITGAEKRYWCCWFYRMWLWPSAMDCAGTMHKIVLHRIAGGRRRGSVTSRGVPTVPAAAARSALQTNSMDWCIFQFGQFNQIK